MQGSWQIYYTNWKTKKGRFAYLAKKEREKARNKERERAKKDAAKEKEREKEREKKFVLAATPSGSAPIAFAYPQDLAMTKPTRKRAKVVNFKHSFTEDEERAMAAHVVNNGLTTVLPSYLTWQTWSENPEGVSLS